MPASTIPYTSTIWPSVSEIAPGRSKLRAAPSFFAPSAITAQAMPAAATPIGGLISKIQRQPNSWVMIPPNSAPDAPPAPFIAPHRAMARCRAGPVGNDIVMAASDEAAMSAPLRPCTDRAMMSIDWLVAAPPASDATANRTRAAASIRRGPNRSLARPPSMRNPANMMAYASTTHCRLTGEKPRADWIEGSATLTMDRSRITMNCATQQTVSSQPRRMPGSPPLVACLSSVLFRRVPTRKFICPQPPLAAWPATR